MLLFSWLSRSNLCRMTHKTFDPQFFHQIQEPLHRSGGFKSPTHRPRELGIKLSHDVLFVLQSRFLYLSRCGVQHRQCLLATVQITSYNLHLGLLRSEHCRVNTEQFTRAVARPASLRHHSGVWTTSSCWSLDRSAGLLLPSLNVHSHHEEPHHHESF